MPTQSEIRSEEIQDIMHRTPKWLTRWGISVLLVLVSMVIIGASYVAYPDRVAADVVIEPYTKPAILTLPAKAMLSRMLIQNQRLVEPNTALWVWSTGDTLRAPIGGKVHLLMPPGTKNGPAPGETIAIIIPVNVPYRIKGSLPTEGSAKVETGQRVIIQLDAYPYREFGSVLASVETISPLETNGHYDIRFALQNGLVTQQGKVITSGTALKGKAIILANERSLLSRIFDII